MRKTFIAAQVDTAATPARTPDSTSEACHGITGANACADRANAVMAAYRAPASDVIMSSMVCFLQLEWAEQFSHGY